MSIQRKPKTAPATAAQDAFIQGAPDASKAAPAAAYERASPRATNGRSP
jgi:hypothetical protein